MGKRCAWGTCNSDERYPDRLGNGIFIPFPKPKTRLDACLRWIKACGRPHLQLNVDNINRHKYVCSKHFKNAAGPTTEYPDPLPAFGGDVIQTRPPPKKRIRLDVYNDDSSLRDLPLKEIENIPQEESVEQNAHDQGTQTHEPLSTSKEQDYATRLMRMEETIRQQEYQMMKMKKRLEEEDKEKEYLKEELLKCQRFSVTSVVERSVKLKGLFKYYTGITYVRFVALLTFLLPNDDQSCLKYEKGRRDIKRLSNQDCLLLTLCRLRHGFGLKDLAMRFGLSIQSSGVVSTPGLIICF